MDEARPTWPHKEMSETEFRKVAAIGMIVSVKAEWEMTGADTSREWLTATNKAGKAFTLPHGWGKALKFVGHASVPGLFGYTYEGERMLKTLVAIDAWEKKHADDRATYERLKSKFAPTPTAQEET
jgi:hypothetical protein